MTPAAAKTCWLPCLLLGAGAAGLHAQKPPYDAFPPAEAPYYRVRYEASAEPGGLAYPVNYTIWIPPGVKALRGVIVQQIYARYVRGHTRDARFARLNERVVALCEAALLAAERGRF